MEKEKIIRILIFDEERGAIPVTIKPDDKSYELAIGAHKESKRIQVTGILEKRGRIWYLKDPEGMKIINEDYE